MTTPQGAYLYVPAQVDELKIVIAKRNLNADEDDAGLAWFDFECENSLAQMTGTLLWDASLAVVQLVNDPSHPLRSLIQGRRVLELGSGVGLAGLCCAAAGGHMMLSDLASIVDGILQRNISHNLTQVAAQVQQQQQQVEQPQAETQLQQLALSDAPQGQLPVQEQAQHQARQEQGKEAPGQQHQQAATDTTTNTAAATTATTKSIDTTSSGCQGAGPWPGSQTLGKGSVASMPVDFCRPLHDQVRGALDPRDAEVVLAIDIVWLRELVSPLVATMTNILTHPAHPAHPAPQTTEAAAPEASEAGAAPHPQAAQAQAGPPPVQPALPVAASSASGKPPQPRQAQQALPGKVGLLAFGERATEGGVNFVTLGEVCAAFEARGCVAEVLGRVVVEKEPGEVMPVAVLKVTVTPP